MALLSASVRSPSWITGTWPKGLIARYSGVFCAPFEEVDLDGLERQAEQ